MDNETIYRVRVEFGSEHTQQGSDTWLVAAADAARCVSLVNDHAKKEGLKHARITSMEELGTVTIRG